MGILVLSIVAGIVVAGGIWLATCETKPAGRETGGRLVKIQIASDLHLEFYPPAEAARYRLPDVGADVLSSLATFISTHGDWSGPRQQKPPKRLFMCPAITSSTTLTCSDSLSRWPKSLKNCALLVASRRFTFWTIGRSSLAACDSWGPLSGRTSFCTATGK